MRILLFAHLRDVVGGSEIELSVKDLDSDGLWRELIAAHPSLEQFRGSVRLARNAEYAGADAVFGEGDEVALIPPVSGG